MRKFKLILLAALLCVAIGIPVHFFSKEAPKPSDDLVYLARNLVFETLQDSHKKAQAGDEQVVRELEAISRVVFARMRAGRREGFPNTVKGVVCQENQFSWTRNPLGCEKQPTNRERYAFMLALAKKHLAGQFMYQWPRESECVMWYKRHDEENVSKRSKDWFEKRLTPVAVYGSHRFYCKKLSAPAVAQARSRK